MDEMENAADAAEADPVTMSTTLTELPSEVLTAMVADLPLPALPRLARTCSLLREIAMSNYVWNAKIAQLFSDVEDCSSANLNGQALFRNLTYGSRSFDEEAWPACAICRGTLLDDDGYRCPCIAQRTRRLPLRFGALGAGRAGSSALSSGGFTELRAFLSSHFVFRGFDEVAELTPATLANLDVLLLCTTEGPALTAAEIHALIAWLRAGGALLTSAFSNWSAYQHYAATTVGFLGLSTVPHGGFLPRLKHTLQPTCAAHNDAVDEPAAKRLLGHGPFGPQGSFLNIGETVFHVQPEAFAMGGIQLSGDMSPPPDRRALLMYYPPKPTSEGGVTGRGRVLVCSNYHWLADRAHWNGGTFSEGSDQQRLLLNFLAGAVAARVGRIG